MIGRAGGLNSTDSTWSPYLLLALPIGLLGVGVLADLIISLKALGGRLSGSLQ